MLPVRPTGKHVLLQLDPDYNLRFATVVGIGSAVPRAYVGGKGISIGDRVIVDKDGVMFEYTDELSAEVIAAYEPVNGDDQDLIPVRYIVVHVDAICGVLLDVLPT